MDQYTSNLAAFPSPNPNKPEVEIITIISKDCVHWYSLDIHMTNFRSAKT